MRIVLFASAHGWGHSVRLAEVARAIMAREPRGQIAFGGRVCPDLLRARLEVPFKIYAGELDIGLVELDYSSQNLAETARRGEHLLEEWDRLRSATAGFLDEWRASAVISDLPGIPLEAAADAGIPSLAVGNFSWDWVYQTYYDTLGLPTFGRLAERFGSAYGTASCLARLPIGPPMPAFRTVVDVGLVGRRGTGDGAQRIRESYGLRSPSAFLAIGKAADREMLERAIDQSSGYHFFGFADLGDGNPSYARLSEAEQACFPDLLRAADVVVATLGHSILSEAAVNGTPIVTPPRLEYPEYDVLLSQGTRVHPVVEIPLDNFRSGRWSDTLDLARTQTPPDPPPSTDGATAIAELVLDLVGSAA